MGVLGDQVRHHRWMAQHARGLWARLVFLHRPVWPNAHSFPECQGCDGVEGDWPDWPCRSWLIMANVDLWYPDPGTDLGKPSINTRQ